MPAIIYPEELKRLAKMPYADVWTEQRIHELNRSAMAPIASEALRKKTQPQHLTIVGLLRDLLRKPRRRLFAPEHGHWACIRMKIKNQKSDKDFIRNVIALGAFLGFVIFSLYQILK